MENNNLHELFTLGNKHYNDKNYAKAIEYYNQYLRICNNESHELASTLYNKGVSLIKLGQNTLAIQTFKKSIEIFLNVKNSKEKIGNNYFNMAYCYGLLGDNYMSYKHFLIAKKYLPYDNSIDKVLDLLKKEIKIC